MKRLLPLLAAGLVLTVWLPSLVVSQPAPSKAQDELQQLTLDLKELKGLVGGVTDKALRERLDKMVVNLETRVANLKKALDVPAGPAKTAVSDADFQKFLASVKKQSFDKDKLPVVRDYAKNVYLTADQAAKVVKEFSFGEGQSDAAIAMHPRLVDAQNFFQVLDVITFDKDKKKVRDALGIK